MPTSSIVRPHVFGFGTIIDIDPTGNDGPAASGPAGADMQAAAALEVLWHVLMRHNMALRSGNSSLKRGFPHSFRLCLSILSRKHDTRRVLAVQSGSR